MTVKELRALLFGIDNQAMTIKELRARLFELQDQDAVVTTELLNEITQ